MLSTISICSDRSTNNPWAGANSRHLVFYPSALPASIITRLTAYLQCRDLLPNAVSCTRLESTHVTRHASNHPHFSLDNRPVVWYMLGSRGALPLGGGMSVRWCGRGWILGPSLMVGTVPTAGLPLRQGRSLPRRGRYLTRSGKKKRGQWSTTWSTVGVAGYVCAVPLTI